MRAKAKTSKVGLTVPDALAFLKTVRPLEEDASNQRVAKLLVAFAKKQREADAIVASAFTVRPDRRVHPDIAWDQMNETAQTVAHSTAQQIAHEIRYGRS